MNRIRQILTLSLVFIGVCLYARPEGDYKKIEGLKAYSSSEATPNKRFIFNIINGSGLNADGSHGVSNTTMWSGKEGGASSHSVVLELPVKDRVVGMNLWNSNWTNYTNRGVKDFTIYYTTEDASVAGLDFSASHWRSFRSCKLGESTGVASYKGEFFDLMTMPSGVKCIGFDIQSNHGGDFAYPMLSEVELYKSSVVLAATAKLSGSTSIVDGGDPAKLKLELTGWAPFDIVYTDGDKEYELTIDDYSAVIEVLPNRTTTYTLVSVSDANGEGSVSGQAEVIVLSEEDVYKHLENDSYEITYNSFSHRLKVVEKSTGAEMDFMPTYYVVRNTNKPVVNQANIEEGFNYKTVTVDGDINYFSPKVGDFYLMEPIGYSMQEGRIVFTYPSQDGFELSSSLELPEGKRGEPQLIASLSSKASAYFSIGYYGAPSYTINEVSEIFQPLPFTEKRFPSKSYLTPAYLSTLPATFATKDGVTYGVVADKAEFPFDPLPTTVARSPFGVAIRDREGKVRPMVWALIMGNAESRLAAGTIYDFNYRLYVSERILSSAYEDVARRHFNFSDFRHNDLGTLNSAFENMLDFAMCEYGRYMEELKGYSYETDIKNSVKNTSSLPIHSVAFIVDDSTMFKERATPITEFMLSRENFTYAQDHQTGAGQTAYNSLGGSCATVSELMGYYALGNNHSEAFLDIAEQNTVSSTNLAFEKKWRENIAKYNATGEREHFLNVVSGADKYISERINTMQTGFNYVNHSKSSFWSSLAPRFWELYETYKITGYERHLDAARVAARSYAYHLWFAPAVDNEMILCNKGGKSGLYRPGTPIQIEEELAPDWRLSCMGLSCECGGTSTSRHRGIFMANHAPFFMRIGALTGDKFLTEIAKAAIIGRWRDFPGYHINSERSTVYEKEKYAYRDMKVLISNSSMHYSHVWPMIALTLDYMVSDAFAKSKGEIEFPSTYIENTANLCNNLYFKPGVFYGDENVTLWMPKGLVKTSNQELNYISARGNGKFYIAFTNQSQGEVTSTITVDDELVKLPSNKAKIWVGGKKRSAISVSGNIFTVTVPAGGIAAVAIDDADVKVKYQDKIYYQSGKNSWSNATNNLTQAKARVMMLGFSNEFTRVYAFSDAAKGVFTNVRFKVYFDGVIQKEVVEDTYPFEMGEWVPRTVKQVRIEIVNSDGTTDSVVFERNAYQLEGSISGWTSVDKGTTVPVIYKTDGKAPWSLTYFNGEEEKSVICEGGTFVDYVTPEKSTTYKVISIVDSEGDNAVFKNKEVKVSVIDASVLDYSIEASEDAYVNKLGAGNKYGKRSNLSIKGKAGSEQQVYVSFALTDLNLKGNAYLLGLYLTEAIASTSVVEVAASEASFDETTITWNNKPDDFDYAKVDTVGLSDLSPEGFHYFDVTDAVKDCTDEYVTFRLSFLMGDEDMTLSFASRNSEDETIRPCLLSDADFQIGTGLEDEIGVDEMRIVIDGGVLSVISSEEILAISMINIAGQMVARVVGQKEIDLTQLNKGVYVVKVDSDSSTNVKRIIVR